MDVVQLNWLCYGKHKIPQKGEEEEYAVNSQPYAGIPVYEVQPVVGGKKRMLQRNLLLTLGSKLRESLVSQSPMKH